MNGREEVATGDGKRMLTILLGLSERDTKAGADESHGRPPVQCDGFGAFRYIKQIEITKTWITIKKI